MPAPPSISPSVAGKKRGKRVDFFRRSDGRWLACFDADELLEYQTTGRVRGIPCSLNAPSDELAYRKTSYYDVRHIPDL